MTKRKSQLGHQDGTEETMAVALAATEEYGVHRRGVFPHRRSVLARSIQSPAQESGIQVSSGSGTTEWTSITTRKSKACASCRKQKV